MQNIFLNGIPFLGSGRSPIHTLSHFFGNRWERGNHHFKIIIALFILNRILILKKVLKIDCHPVVTLINLPGLLLCNPNSRQCLTNDMVAINTRSSVFNFCKLAVTLKITQRGPLLCNPDSRQGVTNAGKKQCKSAADTGNGVSNQPVRERRKIAASKENPTFLDPDHCGYRRYHMIL